jgi:predicted phosphodiesterase
MATAIIGDVHGCLKELKVLIGDLSDRGVTEYIFVGDLVDKGPDSSGVLKYVRNLGDKATVVQGNHESRNIRFWKKVENGGVEKAMEMKYATELSGVMESTDQDLRDWLRSKVVTYVKRDDFVVVHGGITPRMEALPAVLGEMSNKQRKRAERTMFIRFVDDSGSMVVFGEETPQDDFWADIYDGRFGHVYFGHQPFTSHNSPVEFKHATGLDLGCVHGGHLCAAILKDGDNVGFHAVKADSVYCDPIHIC